MSAKHTMKMSREEYIQNKRQRAARIASSMIDGSMNYLEGAIELASLRFEVDLAEDDKDFLAFTVVASEIDHLPIGEFRKNWSQEALDRHEPAIEQSTKWAKDVSLLECKSILERFDV